MKSEYVHDLIEELHNMAKPQTIIELPNGQQVSTNNYYHSDNKRGEMVIVIKAGKKL